MEAKEPKIRFKGFTDPWEQRKFTEVVDVCSGRDYKHLDEGEIPVYGTGGYMTSVCEALSYNEDAIGIGRKGTIDKPYILKAPFWTVDTLFYSIPKREVDLNFAYCCFLNIDWSQKDESTGLPSLSKQAINETDLQAPTIEEQRRIGSFFAELDNLITLHQRKLDSLKNVKKSMLEKMFPKPGEPIPEIRFKGFTDPWEQRKLGDAVDSLEYGLNAAAKPFDGIRRYLRITDIDDDTREYLADDLVSPDVDGEIEERYRLHAGDVVFARTGASVGKTFLNRNNGENIFYAGFLIRGKIKGSFDSEFVYQNTLSDGYRRYIEITSQRSGQPGVNAQEYSEFEFAAPELAEQRRIGSFFAELDNLITLHQRKLDSLKNVKKSLLEKMFV